MKLSTEMLFINLINAQINVIKIKQYLNKKLLIDNFVGQSN